MSSVLPTGTTSSLLSGGSSPSSSPGSTVPSPSGTGAAILTSTGLGSGINISSLVNALVAADQIPVQTLQNQESGYQAQLSAYGQLQSAVSVFQASMQGLSGLSAYQQMSATASDSTHFSATAASNAVPGNYSIQVNQLAQAQSLVSGDFSSTSATVGTGTLTFQFGTYSSGSNTFTVNSSQPAGSVTINSSNDTLSGIASAINAANIGVSASILNDGAGNRLVLTSNNSGAANSLRVTVNDSDGSNTNMSGLSQLAYDPTAAVGSGQNLTQTVAAQNATLSVDGVNVTSPSNTVSSAIQGVTLNLLAANTAGSPTTLTVAQNSTAVTTAVTNFVNAYNTLFNTVSTMTAYNASTNTAGPLQGNPSVQSILTQMQGMLDQNLPAGSGFSNLSQIGVTVQADGTLQLNSTQLQSALASNFNGVASVFAAQGNPTDSQISYVGSGTSTQAGSYAVNITQLATQGSLTGTSTSALASTNGTFNSPLVLNSSNNTFGITVDGVQSGTITLNPGTYSTTASLVGEMQSEINGDSALKAAGAAVTVSYNSANAQLAITSNRYGSSSNVSITSVGTGTGSTLGLGVATGTAGADVSGTIGGYAATGSGQDLTGASNTPVAGLELQVSGGSTGARGTVSFSEGYAYQLNNFATQVLSSSGPIAANTAGINNSITAINNQINQLNQQIANEQAMYYQQFNSMDTLVGQLNSTSNYLTATLGTLPWSNSGGQSGSSGGTKLG